MRVITIFICSFINGGLLKFTYTLHYTYTSKVKKYEYRGISSVCVYGGGSFNEQLKAIEKGTVVGGFIITMKTTLYKCFDP